MKLRDQNGTALIVVLLIITVFFVLGLSIISSALSNTRQVNNTEKEMQAVDLAEMGIIYFQTAVENAYKEVNKDIGVNLKEYISDHKINSKEDFMNTFKKDLELEIAALINEKEIVMNTDSNAKFRFSHSPPIVTSNNTIEITFASNGIIGTEDEKNYVISATIHVIPLLSFNIGEGEENETDSGEINIDDLQNEKNYVSIINTKIDCKKNNCNYSGSTFFKESVVLNRGNSHLTIKNGNVFFAQDVYVDGGTSITVNGNAFFSNGFHLKGSGILNVSGNVYMKSPYYSSTGNGHTLCVSGKIYEIDTNDIMIEKSISKNSCGKSTTNPEPDSELPFVIQWNPTPIMLEDIVYGKKK